MRKPVPFWWLALLAAACGTPPAHQTSPKPVTVGTVEESTGETTVRYSGSVEPNSRLPLAFRLGGYVAEVRTVRGTGSQRPIQAGDRVEKGTVLARLREADYVAKVNQARSQLQQAEAGLEQARSGLRKAEVARRKAQLDLDRAKSLFDKRSLVKPDLDAAQAQFDAAQATVDEVRAQIELGEAQVKAAAALLEEANLALQDCALKAPLTGVLLDRMVEVGSLVGSGTPAFLLADTRTMKVIFGAPDILLSQLKLGQQFSVTTEAVPGVDFPGRVTRISPAADPRSRVFDVEITVPNSDGRLQTGMIATIEIGHPGAEPVPTIPLTAIVRSQQDPQAYAVFVVEQQGEQWIAGERLVKLGSAYGSRIAAVEGVRPGEKIIVVGATLVRDGEPVTIVP